jgi:hypothetical protein
MSFFMKTSPADLGSYNVGRVLPGFVPDLRSVFSHGASAIDVPPDGR